MFSSSNNGIDSFPPYFPLSTSFFGHENPFIPQNPNFLQHNYPNLVDPISNGFFKHFSPSYESDVPKEMPKKKKDMNRKIITARGPRERRVRLSISVAQKFFDLQDMLGFDKASKTLDWLFGQSNSAIEELKRVNDKYVNNINNRKEGANCTSDCEVLSDQTNEDSRNINLKGNFTRDKKTRKYLSQSGRERDSRSKARERARKRTKEKMGATRACDIMHLGTSCPTMNEIEITNYSETMMVNGSNVDACLNVSKAQGTCTNGESVSINESLMKPFPNLNVTSSSNNYQNWEIIGLQDL